MHPAKSFIIYDIQKLHFTSMKLSFDLSPEHHSLIISNKNSNNEKKLASLNDLKNYASTRDATSQPSLLSILRKSKLTFPTVKRFFF